MKVYYNMTNGTDHTSPYDTFEAPLSICKALAVRPLLAIVLPETCTAAMALIKKFPAYQMYKLSTFEIGTRQGSC